MQLSQNHLASRIASAREAAGISQSELAQQVGLTQSGISRIESGDRSVDSLELASIARAVNRSVLDLLEANPAIEGLEIAARWESIDNQFAVRSALTRVLDLVRMHSLLTEQRKSSSFDRSESWLPRVEGERSPVEQGVKLAELIRKDWSIEDDPIPPSFVSLVEDQSGLNVNLEPMNQQVAGLCARVDDYSIAMIDSSSTAGRQRFTVAHELCHYLLGDGELTDESGQGLVIDETISAQRDVEKRANAFAASFLMPRASIERYRRNRDLTEEVIVELQYTFGVSLDAMLWQLFNFGWITRHRRQQVRAMGAKALAFRCGFENEWQTLERDRESWRPPHRLLQLALSGYSKGQIGIEPIASLLGRKDLSKLRLELADQGIEYVEQWWQDAAPA